MKTELEERIDFLMKNLSIFDVLDAIGHPMEKRSTGFNCSCILPSHPGRDSNPSMKIYPHNNTYTCFAETVGGDMIKLAKEVMGYDTILETVEWLENHFGFDSESLSSQVSRILQKIHAAQAKGNNVEAVGTPGPDYETLSSYASIKLFDLSGITRLLFQKMKLYSDYTNMDAVNKVLDGCPFTLKRYTVKTTETGIMLIDWWYHLAYEYLKSVNRDINKK